jgi:hypothetical protein
MNFNNLLDLATKISTESIAIAYFIKMRWNENYSTQKRYIVGSIG